MPNYFLDYIKTIFFINFFHLEDDETDKEFQLAAKKIAGPYSLDLWDCPKFLKFTSKTNFKITDKRLKKGYVRLKHINGWSHIEVRRFESSDGKVHCTLSFFTNRSALPFCQMTIGQSVDYLLTCPPSRVTKKCTLTDKHVDFEIEPYGMYSRDSIMGMHNRIWFISSVYNSMKDSLARVFIMFARCLPLQGSAASDAHLLVSERIPGCYATHFNEKNERIVVNVMDKGVFFTKLKTRGQTRFTLFIDGLMYGYFSTPTGDIREWEHVESMTLNGCPFGRLILYFKTTTLSDVPLFHMSVLNNKKLAAELDGFYHSPDGRLSLVNSDKPQVQAQFFEMDPAAGSDPTCSISFSFNGNTFKLYLPCKDGFKSLSTLSANERSYDDMTFLLDIVYSKDKTLGSQFVLILPVNSLWGAPAVWHLRELELDTIDDTANGRRSFEAALKMMWKKTCSKLVHGPNWHQVIHVLHSRDVESIARHVGGFDPIQFISDLIKIPEYKLKFQEWTYEFIVWEMMNYPVKWQFYAYPRHLPIDATCVQNELPSEDESYESGSDGEPEVVLDGAVRCAADDEPPAAGGCGKRRPDDHPHGRWRYRYRYGNPPQN